jgi:Chemotaxis phosphatase CheX
MSMQHDSQQLDRDLIQLGNHLLETLLPNAPSVCRNLPGELVGWVRAEHGPALAVACDAPLACALAAAMFGRPIDAVDTEEAASALGEMANVLAGNAREILGLTGPLASPIAGPGPIEAEVRNEVSISTFSGEMRLLVFA